MKNEFLFLKIKNLVATERRIGVEILECLYEIEKRKAYAELRYDGLYTYCVKELGFTEAQAYQRIQAMRAVKDLPELKTSIENGALSVSSISKVQAFVRREPRSGRDLTPAAKLELFQSMENLTIREVEAKLAEKKGEVPKEKLVLEMDEELATLWRRAHGLLAHRAPDGNEAALVLLLREWLSRNDPNEEPTRESRRVVPCSSKVETPDDMAPSAPTRTRYIPASLRREIWKRDGGRCTRCDSSHALEVDHRTPFAKGGETTRENLRLLCRSCNGFAAIQAFGVGKMEESRRRADSAQRAVP